MPNGSFKQAGSEWDKTGMIIGRSLAFLCMQSTSVKEGTLLMKADFLSGLGLAYEDAAQMLGTTSASLKELARQAKKPKGEGRGKKRNAKRTK
jgi:hypothetical protein